VTDKVSPVIARLSGGANQARVRAHNERLVLSLVRRHSGVSKAEIARQTGLSPQTVTVIMRALEEEGLLVRGTPQRGRVGQPSVPMLLNPEGAFSLGLKIGRRVVDLVLMNFTGEICGRLRETFDLPQPDHILRFATQGCEALIGSIPAKKRPRIAGLGVAMPFQLWNWADVLDVAPEALAPWRDLDVQAELEAATGLSVLLDNDGTAACGAELLFGRGRECANYAYFYASSFVGGGIVMDNRVIRGPSGNAGALGTVRVAGPDGSMKALLDGASLYVLEDAVCAAGGSGRDVWQNPDSWSGFETILDDWLTATGDYLAQAIVSACSVLDFEAVIIDGTMPGEARARMVAACDQALSRQDLSGVTRPAVMEGALGPNAQVTGAASLPIMARYLVDNDVLFKTPATG